MDTGDPNKRSAEVLEIEDEDDRLKRIESSLFRLNAPGKIQPQDKLSFKFSDASKPHFVPPPTELLSRVQAFLPAFEAANQALNVKAQDDPDSVNMEVVTGDDHQYIQMNLGLGVYEQRRRGSSSTLDQDKEMSTSSSSSSTSSLTDSDANDSDSYDSDEDSDDAEIITCFVPSRPIRPLPKRRPTGRAPQIVVLGETSHPSVSSCQE